MICYGLTSPVTQFFLLLKIIFSYFNLVAESSVLQQQLNSVKKMKKRIRGKKIGRRRRAHPTESSVGCASPQVDCVVDWKLRQGKYLCFFIDYLFSFLKTFQQLLCSSLVSVVYNFIVVYRPWVNSWGFMKRSTTLVKLWLCLITGSFAMDT